MLYMESFIAQPLVMNMILCVEMWSDYKEYIEFLDMEDFISYCL